MQTLLPADELVELNARFEDGGPTRDPVVGARLRARAHRRRVGVPGRGHDRDPHGGPDRPDIPVLFLETGFHFAETLAFKEQLTERLGLNVVDLVGDVYGRASGGGVGPRLYERDPEPCCELNKVQPFFVALRGLDAWITAMRRESSPSAPTAPFVEQYELEPDRWIVKVNPMANWTRRDVWAYLKENDLPHNPLYDLGYARSGARPARGCASGRGGARGPVGGSVQGGVRDPGEPAPTADPAGAAQATTQRASGAS